jgi:manganese/zinc/iron transport system ATP- binding protein
METNALEASQLTVTYGKLSVLWDITLNVPKENLIGIVGPNGAGKSTFLKAALGLVKPLSGHIQFPGVLKNQIAYVPQRDSVDWDFPITVFDVVLMGRYKKTGLFKRVKKADREAAFFALEQCGLASLADRQIGELSGGQKQRLFIARALAKDPKIFLMDEPFAGIDVSSEEVIVSILQKLKNEKKTIFVVHHDLSSVENYFDYLILLRTRLIAAGPVKEIFTKENLTKTYGKNQALFDELTKQSFETF